MGIEGCDAKRRTHAEIRGLTRPERMIVAGRKPGSRAVSDERGFYFAARAPFQLST
jgi:hypothetical protein